MMFDDDELPFLWARVAAAIKGSLVGLAIVGALVVYLVARTGA